MEVNDDPVRNVDSKKRDLYRLAREAKAKKKKAKQVKDRLFLVMQKRVERKPPSYLQKLINMVTRKNLKTEFDIREFLASLGENVSDGTVDYVKLVGQTKVVNGKLTFSDSFANRPIYIPFLIKSAATKVFSNDTLYLAGNLKTNLPNNPFFNAYNKLISNLIVDSIHVISQPFYAENETKKGYIQDYEADFCAIGLEDITEELRDQILNLKVNVKTFNYLGKDYFFSGNEQACIIVSSALVKDTIKLYKAQVRFHLEKKVVSGEKTIKIKGKPRFLDFYAKPDSFCPAYMILPEPVLTYSIIKFHLDYNDLYDILYKQIALGSIQVFSGSVYWDTYSGFFDMSEIACLLIAQDTAQKQLALGMLGPICVEYEKYKAIVAIWAKNQLAICRILSDFYNSCSTKIRHDKMVELRESLNKCIDTRNYLMMDESFENIKKIFRDLGENASFINNQFKDEFTKSCDFLLKVLTKIKSGDFDDLEEDVYQAGYAIYQLGACSDSGIVAIPEVFSTGAFFANVFGEKYAKVPGKTILSQVVNKFVIKEKKDEEKIVDMTGAMSMVLKDLDRYKQQVLENTINKYISESDEYWQKAKKDTKTVLLVSLNSNVYANNDPGIQNMLAEYIAARLSNPKTIETIGSGVIDSPELKNYVIGQIQSLNNDAEMKDIDKKINELKEERDRRKGGGSVAGKTTSSRKTMRFAKSLGPKSVSKLKKGLKSSVSYNTDLESIEEEKDLEIQDKSAWEVRSSVGDPQYENDVFQDDFVLDPNTGKTIQHGLMNRWYLTNLVASGIYQNILNDKKLINALVDEEPARLMANLPISQKILDEIEKGAGIPTLDQVLDGAKLPENPPINEKIEDTMIENATRLIMGDSMLKNSKLPKLSTQDIKNFYINIANKSVPNLKTYRIYKGLNVDEKIENAYKKMSPEEKSYMGKTTEESMIVG